MNTVNNSSVVSYLNMPPGPVRSAQVRACMRVFVRQCVRVCLHGYVQKNCD